MKKNLTELGLKIKIRLAERNMTQREFAEELGTSEVYLSRIMHGERNGNKKYITKIVKMLNLTKPSGKSA